MRKARREDPQHKLAHLAWCSVDSARSGKDTREGLIFDAHPLSAGSEHQLGDI